MAGSFALLFAAFVFQAVGYAPCKICLWQRAPHVLAFLLGGIALWRGDVIPLALGGLSMALTSGLGIYHTGIERDWWAGPSDCTGSGPGLSGMSGSDLLSMNGAPPIAMCDEPAWIFMGLSMASWNAVLSLGIATLWVAAWRAAQRRKTDPATPSKRPAV